MSLAGLPFGRSVGRSVGSAPHVTTHSNYHESSRIKCFCRPMVFVVASLLIITQRDCCEKATNISTYSSSDGIFQQNETAMQTSHITIHDNNNQFLHSLSDPFTFIKQDQAYFQPVTIATVSNENLARQPKRSRLAKFPTNLHCVKIVQPSRSETIMPPTS